MRLKRSLKCKDFSLKLSGRGLGDVSSKMPFNASVFLISFLVNIVIQQIVMVDSLCDNTVLVFAYILLGEAASEQKKAFML